MQPTVTLWPKADCDGAAPRLAALRGEIDRLDDAMLDLVERRLGLSLEIAALKDEDDGRLKLGPRREAEIVDRLTARRGLATPDMIAHLWRELPSHGLQAQRETELVLWSSLTLFGATRLAGGEAGAFLVGRVAAEDVADDQLYRVLDEREVRARLDRGERSAVVRSAGGPRLCHLRAGADR